jgi:hypothetical protein
LVGLIKGLASFIAKKVSLGSPIKGRVKGKNTSPPEKTAVFSFTLRLFSTRS